MKENMIDDSYVWPTNKNYFKEIADKNITVIVTELANDSTYIFIAYSFLDSPIYLKYFIIFF